MIIIILVRCAAQAKINTCKVDVKIKIKSRIRVRIKFRIKFKIKFSANDTLRDDSTFALCIFG